jgi:hypothetical protein
MTSCDDQPRCAENIWSLVASVNIVDSSNFHKASHFELKYNPIAQALAIIDMLIDIAFKIVRHMFCFECVMVYSSAFWKLNKVIRKARHSQATLGPEAFVLQVCKSLNYGSQVGDQWTY